ncbi:RNA polymerase II mediator complex subunit [Sporothrix epigloea]|uniref:Mediator of RNA polymerase II transcription subunit 10 n=1 Tax=Sporothrix epigloea TaxID=1892477 RepID=A0ABP0DJB1_9PEZI
MAPIGHSPTAQAEAAMRDTIQSLYNVMLHTSAYDAAGPGTSLDALVTEVRILSQSLRDVNEVVERDGGATSLDSSTAGRGLPAIPRDLVQYVEAGRNPDIYTREFVELVRRTNQLRAGKSRAFSQFRDTLAGQIRSALPELSSDVDRIMVATAAAPTEAEARARGDHDAQAEQAQGAQGAPSGPRRDPGEAAHGTSTGIIDEFSFSVGHGHEDAMPAAMADLRNGMDAEDCPSANGNGNGTEIASTSAAAGAASMYTGRSLTASASASPAHLGGNSSGTPSGSDGGAVNTTGAGASTIDMLGILPSTPQPFATPSAAGGTSGSGPAGEGGLASGDSAP